VITYEYPLNERIRILMRMEDLFAKHAHFLALNEPLDHHAALLALFEILEVARGDLKSDLIQELERQRLALESLRNNPSVKSDALEEVLANIVATVGQLQGLSGKTGQHLRDNEWVMSIKQRACIPGGVCEFDLPSFHYWLSLDPATRRANLQEWMAPFQPLSSAISIILKILRDSGQPTHRVATKGAYQQMISGRAAQMLRVKLDKSLPCFPEISANKYAINIRFTALGTGLERPKTCDTSVEFDLTLCCL
jgi:cell division protein ZapD